MMEHLGGPLPREGLADKLRLDVASAEAGDSWIFKIVPDDDPHAAAGTVCIWEHEWRGRSINEIGWMVLPAFQGRGLGSEAVRSILQRARAESRWDVVHAFPPVANARSARDVPEDGVLLGRGVRLRVPGPDPALRTLAPRSSNRPLRLGGEPTLHMPGPLRTCRLEGTLEPENSCRSS
jgi:GNAT superfamily N-acetyltransferase